MRFVTFNPRRTSKEKNSIHIYTQLPYSQSFPKGNTLRLQNYKLYRGEDKPPIMANQRHHNPRGKDRRNKSIGSSLEIASYLDAGANKIKKKIRDVERLLQKKRDTLPDTVLVEKERTLQALRLQLENAELRQKAKKYASKYHMVRFFEGKKSIRRYKQALKALERSKEDDSVSEDQRKQLERQLWERKIDVCYVVNFPKIRKYIALYPKGSDKQEGSNNNDMHAADKTDRERQAFRDIISKQLEEHTLPVSFEDIMKGKRLDRDSIGVEVETQSEPKNGRTGSKQHSDSNIDSGLGDNETGKTASGISEEDEEEDFFE